MTFLPRVDRRNKLFLPILFGSLASLVIGTTSQAQRRQDGQEPRPGIYRARDGMWVVDLPPAMEDALDRFDRDFEMWSARDYHSAASKYAYSPRQTPWAVIGDFNGDGRFDIALAGRTDDDAYVLFVLSNGRRRYRVVEAERELLDPDDRRLVRPPTLEYLYPGRYVLEDQRLRHPKEIVVERPAVEVTGGRREGAIVYLIENEQVHPYYLSAGVGGQDSSRSHDPRHKDDKHTHH